MPLNSVIICRNVFSWGIKSKLDNYLELNIDETIYLILISLTKLYQCLTNFHYSWCDNKLHNFGIGDELSINIKAVCLLGQNLLKRNVNRVVNISENCQQPSAIIYFQIHLIHKTNTNKSLQYPFRYMINNPLESNNYRVCLCHLTLISLLV